MCGKEKGEVRYRWHTAENAVAHFNGRRSHDATTDKRYGLEHQLITSMAIKILKACFF